MDNISFYEECARLLGTSYECEPFPYRKRTRWNNRAPGSGRYPGIGIIRVFGDEVHVTLHNPRLIFRGTKEEVLALLSK